jgi:hypothetical protein
MAFGVRAAPSTAGAQKIILADKNCDRFKWYQVEEKIKVPEHYGKGLQSFSPGASTTDGGANPAHFRPLETPRTTDDLGRSWSWTFAAYYMSCYYQIDSATKNIVGEAEHIDPTSAEGYADRDGDPCQPTESPAIASQALNDSGTCDDPADDGGGGGGDTTYDVYCDVYFIWDVYGNILYMEIDWDSCVYVAE